MTLSNTALNKTGTVAEKTIGSRNAYGEEAFTWTTTLTNLPCTVQPVREEIVFNIDGHSYVAKFVAYCNYRADIHEGNRLTVDSKNYFLLSVENDGGRDHHLRMYCIEE